MRFVQCWASRVPPVTQRSGKHFHFSFDHIKCRLGPKLSFLCNVIICSTLKVLWSHYSWVILGQNKIPNVFSENVIINYVLYLGKLQKKLLELNNLSIFLKKNRNFRLEMKCDWWPNKDENTNLEAKGILTRWDDTISLAANIHLYIYIYVFLLKKWRDENMMGLNDGGGLHTASRSSSSCFLLFTTSSNTARIKLTSRDTFRWSPGVPVREQPQKVSSPLWQMRCTILRR